MSTNDPKTVLPDGSFAVVFDPARGFEIHLPEMDEDEELPGEAVALVAAGMRLRDDGEFGEELLRWWEARQTS